MYGAITVASLPSLRQLFVHYRTHRGFSRSSDVAVWASNRDPYSIDFMRGGKRAGVVESGVGVIKGSVADGEVQRRMDVYVQLDEVESGKRLGDVWRGPGRLNERG